MAVYFARRKDIGLIKIGYSGNVPQRFASLSSQFGELELLAVIKSGTRLAEKNIHEMFTHCRVEGEWFAPHEDLLQFIEHAKTEDALTSVESYIEHLRTSVAFVNMPTFAVFIEQFLTIETLDNEDNENWFENTGSWKAAEILLILGGYSERDLAPGVYCMERDGRILPNNTKWIGSADDPARVTIEA